MPRLSAVGISALPAQAVAEGQGRGGCQYTNLELSGTISSMETFQIIYRPEIYNANSAAGSIDCPSLKHQDDSSTRIVHDREERSLLAVKQGQFTEKHLIKPYGQVLEQWAASCAL